MLFKDTNSIFVYMSLLIYVYKLWTMIKQDLNLKHFFWVNFVVKVQLILLAWYYKYLILYLAFWPLTVT